jgi:hypothetical protein
MALICDTSGVYALYDADDAAHKSTTTLVETETGPLLLPVILLAEIDYLLQSCLGTDAALDFVESVGQGEFTLVPLLAEDVLRCRDLLQRIVHSKSDWRMQRSSPPQSGCKSADCLPKITAIFERSSRAVSGISSSCPRINSESEGGSLTCKAASSNDGSIDAESQSRILGIRRHQKRSGNHMQLRPRLQCGYSATGNRHLFWSPERNQSWPPLNALAC